MSNKDISQLFVKSLQTQKLENSIAKNENKILLKGLIGSSLSFLVSSIFSKNQKLTVLILENKETAVLSLSPSFPPTSYITSCSLNTKASIQI